MANLYPKHTGLPVVIWVDNVGSDRHLEHNLPRVKVQNVRGGGKRSDDVFSASISRNPEVLAGENKLSKKDWKEVQEFISSNYKLLMDHWNGEIDEYELKDLVSR